MATTTQAAEFKTAIPLGMNDNNKGVVEAPKRLILFIHGIRDPGFWTVLLSNLFEAEGFVAKPIGYGVYDAFRFLLGLRRKPVAMVRQQIVNAISDPENQDAEVTIIAHSFGSYIVSRILEDDPSIKITRLVMCGGIVKQAYRWDKVARFNVQKPRSRIQIINEHSARDIWPIMARHATFGFGDSGATGTANRADVQNRLHDMPHSDYLTLAFANEHWIPVIAKGQKLAYPNVTKRPPWFFIFTKSPFPAILAVFLLLLCFGAYCVWDFVKFRTEATFTKLGDVGVTVEIDGYTDEDKDHSVRLYTASDVRHKNVQEFRSEALLKVISVTISNRYPLKCESGAAESMDAFTLGARAKELTTVYEFDLSKSYGFFGNAELDFKYQGRITKDIDAPQADLLTIAAGGKLNPKKIITSSVVHTEKCLTEDKGKLVVMNAAADFSKNGYFGFMPRAWGAVLVNRLDAQSVLELLQKGDAEQRAVGLEAIAADPAEYKEIAEAYFNGALMNHAALADAIRTVRKIVVTGVGAKSGVSINFDVSKMIELAYAGPPQVRDAARSYLRTPGIATRELASRFSGEEFTDKVKALKAVTVNGGSRAYFQDYLLLITARDVFYNLGLNELAPHLDAIRNKKPGTLEAVLAPFDAGMKLRALTGKNEEKVALAKNTYGKGLAMFETAVNLQAAAKAGPEGVLKYIEAQKPNTKPLDDKVAARKIGDQFKAFLSEVKGQEDLYPWPSHVEQAKRCANSLTFACLNSEAPEAQ